MYTKWWFSLINNEVSCPGCHGWSQNILETLLHVSAEAELKMDTYTWKTKQIGIRNEIIVNFFESWSLHTMILCHFYNVSWFVAKDSTELCFMFLSKRNSKSTHIHRERSRMVPIMKSLSNDLKLYMYTKWWFPLINNEVSCPGCHGWSQNILETLLHISVEAELKMDTYTGKTKQIGIRNESIVNFFESWSLHTRILYHFYNVS